MDDQERTEAIEQLIRLKDQGILSEEEYKEKIKILFNDQKENNSNQAIQQKNSKSNAQKSKGNGYGFGCAIFILLMLAIIGIAIFSYNNNKVQQPKYSSSYSGSTYRNLTKTEAWIIAMDYVKDKLKSPSTAKYSYLLDDYKIVNNSDTWTVSGYIEAQNSFGALLKNHFETKFRVYQNNGKDMVEEIYTNIY